MNVLTDYKISFGVHKIHNTDFKFISSINPYLDGMLSEFGNVIHCDVLLDVINQRMSKPLQSEDFLYTTQGLQMIKIGFSETKLYHDVEEYEANTGMTANYTLPTIDFKEIVEAWRNFVVNGNHEEKLM